jgi:1,4-alpha-glucan branching enzyme
MRSNFYSALLTVVLLVFSCQAMMAQIVTSTPYFPTRSSTVTITYDASQGNGALIGANAVYFASGLITDNSGSAPVNWLYAQGTGTNWGTANPAYLMTSIGNNKWQATFNIATLYGDNTTDTIEKLAFVFRNVDGSLVGRTAMGGDMYLNVYNDSLQCGFLSPQSGSILSATINSTMNFTCVSSQNSYLTLLANGNQLYPTGSPVLTDSFAVSNYTFLNYGTYHFQLSAVNGVHTAASFVDVIVNPTVVQQNPPAGVVEGINYINDSTAILELLAPYKNFVYLLGDFNSWQVNTNYFMKRALDGEHWWIEVDHLNPQTQYLYQYDVDGAIRIGDPYCDEVSDPGTDPYIPSSIYPTLPHYPTGLTTGIASVLQTGQTPYVWTDTNYVKPDKHNMVIYELLVRDFQTLNDYTKLEDSLTYLQKLGINAIELMPIMNFESSSSWGYDPNYFQAPDKLYGTKATLKHFINTCHQKGIAVILDIAFNDAFQSCPMVQLYWDSVNQYPAANNPWFNQVAPHPYSVGYDFNHNSTYTQNYLDRTTAYWIQQYHVDGYRFDLAKGYTQTYSGGDVGLWGDYDTMRIRLIERMSDKIWSVDSSSIVILEYFANNSEEVQLAAYHHGIMMWGYDLNPAYNQCTMGYTSNADISNVSYQYDGWTSPNEVGYMESHDEERLMYNNEKYGDSIAGYNVKPVDSGCVRVECAAALFIPVPGPKMMWMFGERGYDISINSNGRINPKPPLWNYMAIPARLHLFKVYAALIKLKLTYPVFTTTNYNVDMANVVKKMWLVSPGGPGSFDAQVIGNFDVVNQTAQPYFQHTGWWYDYFTGDSIDVTDANMSITLKPSEYHLYTDVSLPVPDLVDTVAKPNGIVDPAHFSTDNVLVYPMPTQGIVNFLSEDGKAIGKITINDLEGRVVFQQNYEGNQPVINIQLADNLNSGMYIYTVVVNNILHTGKLSIFK